MSITIDRPDTQSARRTRLVAEGVVAAYINDLSMAAAPPAGARRDGLWMQRPARREEGGRTGRAARQEVEHPLRLLGPDLVDAEAQRMPAGAQDEDVLARLAEAKAPPRRDANPACI